MEYTYFEANESTKGIPLIKQEYRAYTYGDVDLNKINDKSQFFYEMCKAGYTKCASNTANENELLFELGDSDIYLMIYNYLPGQCYELDVEYYKSMSAEVRYLKKQIVEYEKSLKELLTARKAIYDVLPDEGRLKVELEE